MNQQKWLDWRREGIGGSDAPVIMEKSPFKKKVELWNEKVNGIYSTKLSVAMQHGKDKEEEALVECENLLGISLFKMDYVKHQTIPWLRGNLDGIDIDEEIIVEVKNPYSNPDDHISAINKIVPEKYYPQCMHYFLLKPKVQKVLYFSRYKGNNAIVEIKRDQNYLDELFEKEQQFWDSVQKKIPPKEAEEFVDLSDSMEWKTSIEKWKSYSLESKTYAKLEKEEKEKLIQLSKGKSAIGHGYKLSRQDCDGFLDTKRLKIDYPDIPWDSYKKEYFTKWRIDAINRQ